MASLVLLCKHTQYTTSLVNQTAPTSPALDVVMKYIQSWGGGSGLAHETKYTTWQTDAPYHMVAARTVRLIMIGWSCSDFGKH